MKTICITDNGDGSFSVYEDAQMNNEGDPQGGVQPEAQTAATIDEALEAARALLGSSDEEQTAPEPAEAAMQAGFTKARGPVM